MITMTMRRRVIIMMKINFGNDDNSDFWNDDDRNV